MQGLIIKTVIACLAFLLPLSTFAAEKPDRDSAKKLTGAATELKTLTVSFEKRRSELTKELNSLKVVMMGDSITGQHLTK